MATSHELVDWSVAKRVGRAIAGGGPSVEPAEARRIVDDFHEHVDTADRLVREYTSLEPARDPGATAVLSRGAWIDANVDALRSLLRPLGDRLASRGGVDRRLGRMAIGLQIGILLGYISQKVLGQYDLLLATGEPGRVYFVGPNIVAAERRSDLNPRDFRLWIALHEVTHRTQFLAVPWLRERVAHLIEQYLAGIKVDRDRLREAMARIKELVAGGPDAWRRANVIQIFLSGEQREAIDRMQSLMSVVEGHGNFVMDGVAATQIPSYGMLRDALDRQRERTGGAERAFQRLIALDMKYEQYAVGQKFFDAVAAGGGMDAVNRVWDAPENLPSLSELRDPAAWMRRVSPQPSLFDDPSP
ncbi:MAG TPA: zinc-dependent metalloprotease [Actinomycetota bacterium]|jgi:coenzyme F420 biosynthesis associated uncharacterized protein